MEFCRPEHKVCMRSKMSTMYDYCEYGEIISRWKQMEIVLQRVDTDFTALAWIILVYHRIQHPPVVTRRNVLAGAYNASLRLCRESVI